MSEFTVRIEISKGTNVKYEFDHDTHQLLCDRILHCPMAYPFSYGYIEGTLGGDGDPLDAVVLCEEPLFPTCLIKCRPIGYLFTEDNNGEDYKIIMVPVTKVDPFFKDIHELSNLSKNRLEKIKFFFENYKKLEPNKWVKVGDWGDSIQAIEIVNKSFIDKK